MNFLDKEGNPVERQRWQWVATYKDNTKLHQFDEDTKKYHYFGEIDHSQTDKFGLVCPANGKSAFLDIPEGAKLIHFYDNIVQQPLNGEAIRHRLFGFGYETDTDKKLFIVLPNDFVVEGESSQVGIL